MAKANSKATKVKQMNEKFDSLYQILEDVRVGSEEIMPLLSSSIDLSKKILKTYQKAFNVGTKYVK